MPKQQQTEAEAFVEECRRRQTQRDALPPVSHSDKIWEYILIGTLIIFAVGALIGLVIFASVHGIHP